MKISSDSQYALVNHAPDVRVGTDLRIVLTMCKLGDPFVGLTYGSSGPQVHGSAARPTHNSQLFWWSGRQFRS